MSTSYCEGCSVGTTKYPCVLVVTDRAKPVPVCMTFTVAAGTTAPEESVTVPTMVPKPWPYAVAAELITTIAETKNFVRSRSERLNMILSSPSVALARPATPRGVQCYVFADECGRRESPETGQCFHRAAVRCVGYLPLRSLSQFKISNVTVKVIKMTH